MLRTHFGRYKSSVWDSIPGPVVNLSVLFKSLSVSHVTVVKYIYFSWPNLSIPCRLTDCCSVILFMLGVFHETGCCLGSHSGGTLHIFVSCYQSETSGWVPAASHRLSCPDITRLSAAAWVQPWQLCIDHLKCGSAAFLFSALIVAQAQAKAAECLLVISGQPNATVLAWSGIASFPFQLRLQPLSIYDDLSSPQVSSSEIVKLQRLCFPTYHLFTGNLSQVVQCLESGMFVLLPSIEKGIYSSIFNSSDTDTTHCCQVLLVSFLRWLRMILKVCRSFSTNSVLLQYVIPRITRCNCVTPTELSFKFTCTSWPQEQALSLSRSNLLSN